MELKRSEIATGLFVLVSAAMIVAVIFMLSSPGFFRGSRTHYVLVDNAFGIKKGSPVMLAGRLIGEVVEIESPTALASRPKEFTDYETKLTVRVESSARIFKKVEVLVLKDGLIGDTYIDFVHGAESSGLAEQGHEFVADRTRDALDMLAKVSLSAERTLNELRRTIRKVNGFVEDDGLLYQTAKNARDLTDTLKREPWRLIWKRKKTYPEDKLQVKK